MHQSSCCRASSVAVRKRSTSSSRRSISSSSSRMRSESSAIGQLRLEDRRDCDVDFVVVFFAADFLAAAVFLAGLLFAAVFLAVPREPSPDREDDELFFAELPERRRDPLDPLPPPSLTSLSWISPVQPSTSSWCSSVLLATYRRKCRSSTRARRPWAR